MENRNWWENVRAKKNQFRSPRTERGFGSGYRSPPTRCGIWIMGEICKIPSGVLDKAPTTRRVHTVSAVVQYTHEEWPLLSLRVWKKSTVYCTWFKQKCSFSQFWTRIILILYLTKTYEICLRNLRITEYLWHSYNVIKNVAFGRRYM